MHARLIITTLLITLAQISQSDAAFEPRHALSRASERLHKFAKRRWHGKGLARDLRVALRGLNGEKQFAVDAAGSAPGKMICARPDSQGVLGSGIATATSPATHPSSSGGTSTSTMLGSVTSISTKNVDSPTPPPPVPSSAYTLVESHVRCPQVLGNRLLTIYSQSGASFFSGWSFWNTSDPSGGTVQYLGQADAACCLTFSFLRH